LALLMERASCSGKEPSTKSSKSTITRGTAQATGAAQSEEQLFVPEELSGLFDNALDPYSSRLKGYVGNRFSVTTPERTVLFAV
jgi:hypothetical protein